MANVNIHFGATKTTNSWAVIQSTLTTILSLATQYGLSVTAFNPQFLWQEGTSTLRGVRFYYVKKDLSEAELTTFNDLWRTLTFQNGWVREQTTIEYLQT
jgi:hypothetical protein